MQIHRKGINLVGQVRRLSQAIDDWRFRDIPLTDKSPLTTVSLSFPKLKRYLILTASLPPHESITSLDRILIFASVRRKHAAQTPGPGRPTGLRRFAEHRLQLTGLRDFVWASLC